MSITSILVSHNPFVAYAGIVIGGSFAFAGVILGIIYLVQKIGRK